MTIIGPRKMGKDSAAAARGAIQMLLCIKCWKWTAHDPCECGGDVQHPEYRSRRVQPNGAEYWYKSSTRGGREPGPGLEGVWLDESANLSQEQIDEMLRLITDRERWGKTWTDRPNQSPWQRRQPPIPKKPKK